jgi:hypothetical protein
MTQAVGSAGTAAAQAAKGLYNPANLPKLDLPTYQAADPFDAYLLSLSDPAAIAAAAVTRLATAGNTATANGNPASAALRLLAGTGATGATTLAGAVAQALGATGQDTGAGSVATAALTGAVLAGNGSDALTALAGTQALDAQNAAADAATAAEQAYADGAATDAAASDQAAKQQADAQAAALAAQNAVATPAAVAAMAAVLADATGAARSDYDRATDATAKFMGAGSLSQAGAAGLGQTGPAAQDAIPALNGVGAARFEAANTFSYGNPQERAFGQHAARTPAVPFLNPLEGSRVDITG